MIKKVRLGIGWSLGLLLVAVWLGGCSAPPAFKLTENEDKGSVVLYYFWGNGCSHCEAAKPWLEELDKRYPELSIRAYEIWYSEKNQGLYNQMAATHKLPEQGRGTPTFYLNEQYWLGYGPTTGPAIEEAVKTCLAQGCTDAGVGVMPGAVATRSPGTTAGTASAAPASDILEIPWFGSVDLSHQSLLVSTLLISFVDGVNPCSVWVLTMLLALTLHTGSRKKVLIIGLIFLTVTAGIYALFIAGLFTMFTFVRFIGWIQVGVSLLALFFAIVNIKDYFWYKEGLSFTIADGQKPGIFQRMRKLMDASQSFWGLASATVVMSAGVSLVEFSCTAGFPVLWTNLLVAQQASALTFVLLLLVYMFIYQLDEMAIFFTAVFTLKASRLEEKQGRILKLVGGMLMLTLAIVMLVNPAWLNSLSKSLIIFAVAFGLMGVVLVLHRRILPAFGIWIGTEEGGLKRTQRRSAAARSRHKGS
jgi:thiol-disulfide isomerase/thioredoxin